jgi:hypothetical protein
VAYALLAVVFVAWALRASGLKPREALVPRGEDIESVRRSLGRLRGLRAMLHA